MKTYTKTPKRRAKYSTLSEFQVRFIAVILPQTAIRFDGESV